MGHPAGQRGSAGRGDSSMVADSLWAGRSIWTSRRAAPHAADAMQVWRAPFLSEWVTIGPTHPLAVGQTAMVAWFLRAIELDDGWWACRWSVEEFDRHPTLEESLSHLRELAVDHAPADIYVHRLDGQVSRA